MVDGLLSGGGARLLRWVIATQQRTIDYLIEQATGAGTGPAKSMFGEYGVYVDGKMMGRFATISSS